jgi:hypothetical protein
MRIKMERTERHGLAVTLYYDEKARRFEVVTEATDLENRYALRHQSEAEARRDYDRKVELLELLA